MSPSRFTVFFFLTACVVGCQQKKPAPLPPPATAFTAERFQTEFQQVDPTARVGLIAAVSMQNHLVAVSHLDVTDFHIGEPITFMDSTKTLLGTGTVIRTVDDLLIVHYTTTHRPPHKGDLAVRVKA